MKPWLIIFARAPRRGQGKRRLAAGIGDAAALSFYRRSLQTLLRRVARDSRWRTVLAVTPDRLSRGWPARLPLLPQGRGDLGVRMARALRTAAPAPACVIGADIPDLDAPHVWRAFRALAGSDVVFGPATDGGYWLIGARGRARWVDLFKNVRWSSEHALADTRANLAGLRVALVDELHDVDDAEAYRRRRKR